MKKIFLALLLIVLGFTMKADFILAQENQVEIHFFYSAICPHCAEEEEFLKGWLSTKTNNENTGVALLLEPTPKFYELKGEKSDRTKIGFLFKYLKPHKKYIIQLFLGMLLGSLLQLIFPFLTQAVVDTGIGNQNLGFITLILIAQLVLFAGRMYPVKTQG